MTTGTRWQLFRVFGIPISLDASWLIIFALLTWTITSFFAALLPEYVAATHWGIGLATALAFFVCIVLHEMGHALVARREGIPIRGITLFLFGGVAELEGEPKSPKDEFFMAIAGPIVSVVLAAGFWAASTLGWIEPVRLAMWYLFAFNLAILVFNMLPAFPLDGGRVFRSILWWSTGNLRKATRISAAFGQGLGWLLIAFGILNLFAGAFFAGIWFGLIGWFLNAIARNSYQQVLVRQALAGEKVRRFMNQQPITVPPDVDLRHWVDDYVYRYHRKMFPVASNGHLDGYVTTQALSQVPREEWGHCRVGDVTRRDFEAVSISPEADAMDALERMQKSGSSRLMVIDGEQLVGIISIKDLLRFLSLKIELEDSDR